jgi:hypothetical protein
MRNGLWLVALLVTGCDQIDGTEGWFPPTEPAPLSEATAAAQEAPEAEVAEASHEPGGHGAAEAAPPEVEQELTDAQVLALAMGIDPSTVTEPEPEPEPVVEDLPPAAMVALHSAADQEPRAVLGDVGWGVRLVALVPGTQPPRAVLGLTSGKEVVVEPGSFVEEARLVVLAIGNEGVQVAYVEPQGDRASVRTENLVPLNRSRSVSFDR